MSPIVKKQPQPLQQKPPTNAKRSQGRPAAAPHGAKSLSRRTPAPASEATLTMVGLGRLERPTSPLSGVRSNHLSYRPKPGSRSARPVVRMMRKRNEGGIVPPNGALFDLSPVYPMIFDWLSHRRSSRSAEPSPKRKILRKEVIQPQVPLRLPCYDFTPVADPTVVACPLAVGAAPSGKTNSHGVTGGVYKARERIHRGMLIHDY